MTHAEVIYRAWIIIGLGFAFLVLSGLQIWSGKAFVGYGWRKSAWAHRRKEPFLFWGNIVPLVVLGGFAVLLGLSRFL